MCVMADVPLRISIRNMPSSLWRRLRVLALERNVATHKIVIEAIGDYLDRADEPDEQDRLLAFNKRHV